VPRGVNLSQHGLVAFPQGFKAHRRDNVRRAIQVVARGFPPETALLLHTLERPQLGRGLEQNHYRGHNAALLNEPNLPLEDVEPIVVKTDDKPAQHLQPGSLDAFDVFHGAAIPILGLATLGQAILVRGLDADEDPVESGLDHLFHQGSVVRQIDGHLGEEYQSLLALSPLDEDGQEFVFQERLVADEVVVHEEDIIAPAAGVEAIQFGDDLLRGLSPHAVTERGDDVAEIAVERAAARALDAHTGVSPGSSNSQRGCGVCRTSAYWADSYIRFAFPCARSLRNAGSVNSASFDMKWSTATNCSCSVWKSGLPACLPAPVNDLTRGFPLEDHGDDEGAVGSGQVLLRKLRYIGVNEAFGPFLRQHGRDGQESQGGIAALTRELQCVLEAPKRILELRVDQRDIHPRFLLLRYFHYTSLSRLLN